MPLKPLLRQLAVIVQADVIGSTTLVQRDETIAHQRIQSAFHRFAEIIEAYGGSPANCVAMRCSPSSNGRPTRWPL